MALADQDSVVRVPKVVPVDREGHRQEVLEGQEGRAFRGGQAE